MTEFEKLKDIISRLRSKDGCPWDREQTHDSLLPFLLEETNEVADTVIRNDMVHLKEELGDLLLQIMLHSEIESENSHFNIDNVIKDLNDKLVRRHPHVFGTENAENPDEVIKLWDNVKKKEKKHDNKHLLNKVPHNFSPLLRSFKLQKEASKAGFDWKDYNGPLEKLDEEVEELKDAIKSGDKKNIEHEIGDIFFALVNIGKFLTSVEMLH